VADAVGLGQSESILIGDQSAGDATAGIPGRITLVIIRVCVDDKRRTIRVEHGIRTAFLQRDRRVPLFAAAARIRYPGAKCLSSSLTDSYFASRACAKQMRAISTRASSGVIESWGFPFAIRWVSLSSLIRLWEAGRWRGHTPRTCASG
jgi:hypothetical protein